MYDDLFWASGCQGFAFGPLLNDYAVPDLGENLVKNGQMYSIFDSGSTTIQFPGSLLDHFLKAILVEAGDKDIVYYHDTNGVIAPCDLKYPPIHFMFD